MSDREQENMLDWIRMSTTEVVVATGNKGSIYEQLERVFLANEYRIGTLEVQFINSIQSNTTNEELLRLVHQLSTKEERVGGNANIQYPLSDIPYKYWTYEMLIIHGEVKAIAHQNEMIETILEQNKPSLLAGLPDQQE